MRLLTLLTAVSLSFSAASAFQHNHYLRSLYNPSIRARSIEAAELYARDAEFDDLYERDADFDDLYARDAELDEQLLYARDSDFTVGRRHLTAAQKAALEQTFKSWQANYQATQNPHAFAMATQIHNRLMAG
ncbi:hypothetical protein MMC13_008252 [Lambiella insularis]|nr:hypothetical protein [Lambiella insularis]